MGRRTRSRRNKTSGLHEFVKLAGDIVEDGMNLFKGEAREDDESLLDNSTDEGSSSSFSEGEEESEEDKALIKKREELRRRNEEEAENMRRHKEIGEDRERDLRERLSKLEDFYGTKESLEPEKKSSNDMPKKATTKVFGKIRKAPCPEDQTFQVVYEEEESSLHRIVDPEDVLDDTTWDEDDYAEQRVHEMMQLLHHCQKIMDEAQRLIGYKKSAVQQNREVHPDLEAQIVRTVSHRKLEVSTRRFMSYMKNGEMPKTLETLEMEKELLENIKSMKAMAEESNHMSLMHHEFLSLVDAAE